MADEQKACHSDGSGSDRGISDWSGAFIALPRSLSRCRSVGMGQCWLARMSNETAGRDRLPRRLGFVACSFHPSEEIRRRVPPGDAGLGPKCRWGLISAASAVGSASTHAARPGARPAARAAIRNLS